MKKLIFLIVLAIGVSHLAEAQSKSGYQIQGARKKKPGRSGSSALSDKVVVGFTPSLGGGENYFILGLTPTVGYKILDPWIAGVGLTYSFQRYYQENFDSYGPNLFTRFIIDEKYILAASYDWTNYKDLVMTNTGVEKISKWYSTLFLGGGISQPIGSNGSFQIVVFYNVKYSGAVGADNGPYYSPLLFLPGFYYNF